MNENVGENFSDDKLKNYIAKTADGYLLVVYGGAGEGARETHITDAGTVEAITALLRARKAAGETLSKLIEDKGIISGSAHRATIALGEGD